MIKSLTPLGKGLRAFGLLTATAPVIGAFVYNTGFQVPGLVCPIRHFTGVPCPTCGMTRAFMALARGDILVSLQHHVLGIALFLAFLVAVVHFSLELRQNRPIRTRYTAWLGQVNHQLMLIGILLGYHSLRLVYWGFSGELQQSILQAPLGQWFFSMAL